MLREWRLWPPPRFGRLIDVPSSTLLAFLLALAPAVIAWWTGRGIPARINDPALPEILLDRRRQLGKITLAGAVALALLAGSELYWALPLLWIALLISGYPLRRTLFGERWSLPAFLRYAIAAGIGHAGWRLLAAIGPLVALTSAYGMDPNGGPVTQRVALWVGGAIAVTIVIWQQCYARVWLDLHRASPLRATARPELVARLDAVLDRATLARRPGVYRFGAPGGHFVNALAIPSLRAPAVALSDGLLAALTDDEIVAVFAHEVAHHEQFTRRRLRVSALAGVVVALLSVAVPVAFITMGPGLATFGAAALCAAVVIALGKRPSARRDAETASDLRAAALTGDAESLATALAKVHLYNRVPRRWPHAIEQGATHPSLARRIQALRAAAPAPSAPVVETPAALVAVRSPGSNAVVVLEAARAHWFEGVAPDTALELNALRAAASSYRAIAYSDLLELRVGTSRDERTLNAVDRHGHAWTVRIAPADVAPLQRVLDAIDVKLGPRPPALQPTGLATARLVAIATLVALAVSGEAGIVLVPILFVLFRPGLTAALAAAGAIAVGRAFVALTTFAWIDTSRQMSVAGALAGALTLLVLAVLRARAEERRDPVRRPPREAWLLVLLLSCAALMLAIAVVPSGLARPQSLLSNPPLVSAMATLAGIGAAIGTMSGRWRRIGGSATTVAALGGTLLLAGNGSLYNRTAAVQWTTGRLTPSGTAMIPGSGSSALELSPNGRSYVVTQFRAGRRGAPGNRFLVGQFGVGAPTPRASDALQVALLSDDTLLAVALHGTDSLELRAERLVTDSLGNGAVLWRRLLPSIELPRLLLDRTRRVWIVMGRGEDERDVIVATGNFDGTTLRTYRHASATAPDIGEVMSQPLAAFVDGSAIWFTLPGLRDPASSFEPMLMLMAAAPRWELRSSGPAGEGVLADLEGIPQCGSEVDPFGATCVEHSANRTRLWRVGVGEATAAGDLPAALNGVHPLGGGRVAAIERFGTRLALVDLRSHRGTRFTLPPDGSPATGDVRWAADVAAAGPYLAVLSNGGRSSIVRRYRVR